MHQEPYIRIEPPELDPATVRRAVRTGGCLLALLLIGVLVLSTVLPYTEFLWYRHDARQPGVFTTAYSAKGTLFLVTFLAAWALLYFNLRKALSLSLVFLGRPESGGQIMMTQLIKWLQDKGGAVVRFGAPAFAFFAALGFANEWNTYLLAANAQSFGVKDPTFGFDVGFFVFTLPWYRAVANFAFAMLFLTTLLTIGVYVGMQGMAAVAKVELNRPQIRFHGSLLIGLTAAAYALLSFLKTYEVGLEPGGQFTGAGAAGMQQFWAARIFSVLLLLAAVYVVVAYKKGQPFRSAMVAGVGIAAFYGVGVLLYPALVQRFYVTPNRLNVEPPFADRAIRMTRWAYGLDKIEFRDMDAQATPSTQAVSRAESTLENVRLWDPNILREALDTLQRIRPYYAFHDVDIDRYDIDGKQTLVMLAPRDIELDGLESGAQDWVNQRLRYTHGFGIVATRVDAATSEGHPVFLAKDIPQKANAETLSLDQPRVYFSDIRSPGGNLVDEYALVNTGLDELDYPTSTGSETHQWKGDRGIPVSGLLSRLAYAIRLQDVNLLISPNIKPGAKLLIRRNVIDRATKIYPFLRFDDDPYVVVNDGRLSWILDGYTTTDSVPYSARVGTDLNYMRNSVKVVIDAYTGESTAYAVQPEEPILKAYRKVYPGLVRDLETIPPTLRKHFRYPEDLFWVQSNLLTAYHVTDPVVFLTNSDAWSIAQERAIQGQQALIRPYYVQMRLPDEPKAGMLLILPFTPRNRPNMIGWLGAHCDLEDYGRLTLYRFTGATPVPGPETIEAQFNSTEEISFVNRQYNNEQSEVQVGNTLVLPIGNSVLYSEALFLRSKTRGLGAVPRLFRVALAMGEEIVLEETYSGALERLFGQAAPVEATSAPPSEPDEPTPRPAAPDRATGIIREALDLLEQADAALRTGDFAKYGRLQQQARAKLRGSLNNGT